LTCREFVELVTDYLDGALAPAVVDQIDAHLDLCPGCVTVVDQWRTVVALAGGLREDHVDELAPSVRDDLFASFRAAFPAGDEPPER
jgi:hypothetical protein